MILLFRVATDQNAQQQVPYNAEISIQFGIISDAHFTVPIPPHWHNDFELVAVLEGQIRYSINGNYYALSPGDGICVAPGQLHGVEPVGKCLYAALVIAPDAWCSDTGLRKKYLDHLITDVRILRDSTPEESHALDAIRRITEECIDRNYGYELRVKSLLLTMLNSLKTSAHSDERPDPNLDTLKAMIKAIYDALPEQPTLSQIASAGAVSESTCCRLFKRYLKTSPVQHAILLRLQNSLNYLQDSSLTISEAAMASGFSSPSYYTEQFQRCYGLSPRVFRAHLQAATRSVPEK